MSKGICSVEDCTRDVLAREMCSLHYTRWNKYGDVHHVEKMGRKPGPVTLCSINECGRPVVANGWCDTHYRRWKKAGDPLITKRILGDIEARWWSHVDRRGDYECWPWKGAPSREGYGVFGVGQLVVKAHVWGYERFVEPIPEDDPVLDHKCHSRETSCAGGVCPHRLCVNFLQTGPDSQHLQPVTYRENSLRGRRTKMSDEVVAGLHARWLAGEPADALALEVGTHRTNLYKRFRRIAA
jgi:hypothetical protein